MGTENLETPWISPATKTSSWPVVVGSIDDAVTCDSSISAINSDSDPDPDHDHAVSLRHKSPLVLCRPSPDSTPCEITIGFAQQHEIKQVYVRSTARVYEIYYASNEKDGNEYLCTVRCGVAARNEELLNETDVVGSLSTSSSASDGCVDEAITVSRSSNNEDGWVDVKVPHSSGHDQGGCFLPKKSENFMERCDQDLYEASAEISDADPVLSVTLRLLSIQSGDYIYIDEVYVFADPVLSDDMDSSAKMPENSSGNALMSMLVPTFLQLSKSRMNQIQEQNDSARGERRKHYDTENRSSGLAITPNAFQQERMQSAMFDAASNYMSKPEVPVQTPDPQSSMYSSRREIPCSHIERSLDELVSRIAKIEQFCSRFEENLVKPIRSMETRLERVEQQLESFVKASHFPRTASTRVLVPETFCNESESNSICADVNDYTRPRKSDSINKDDCCLEEPRVPPSDASSSANAVRSSSMPTSNSVSQLLPSLVITAPDFSNVDDEDEDDAVEAVNDLPNDNSKKPLSIDDALAFALAGFLSSTSTIPLKCSDNVAESADCISVEGRWNTSAPQSDDPVLSSVQIIGGNETTTSCKDLIVAEQESPSADNSYEETIEAVDKQVCNCEEVNKVLAGSSVDNAINLDKGELKEGDLTAEVKSREAVDDLEIAFISDYSDIPTPTHVIYAPSNNDSVANSLVPEGNIDSPFVKEVAKEDPEALQIVVPDSNIDSPFGKEVAKEDSEVLQNILKLPSPVMLDFKIPILDVKFASPKNSSAKSPLEALLTDVPEFQSEVLCIKEDDGCLFTEQNDLVMIENEDSTTSETLNDQFCLDNCNSGYMPSNVEEEQQNLQTCDSQDKCASFI